MPKPSTRTRFSTMFDDRGDDLQLEEPPRQLLPREPARDREGAELGRRGPDADGEIDAGEPFGLLGPLEDRQHGRQDQRLERDQAEAEGARDDQRAGEHVDDAPAVAGPERLSRERARAELQEVEDGEQQRDRLRAERHGGDVDGIAQIADDRRVDRPLQRHGRVRHHHRQRDRGDPGIGHAAARQRRRGLCVRQVGQAGVRLSAIEIRTSVPP